MDKPKQPRREFIKTATVASAGAGLGLRMPSLSYARMSNKNAPSDTVVVGIMGTNGRGTALSRGFANHPAADVAYVCDVDERAIDKANGAVHAVSGQRPKGVKDFRQILDDSSVDALVIAAPDHWHAPAAILACSAGKHVYVEKPCSHNPQEGEQLVAAARKHNRVVQMGNQRRSWPKMIEAVAQLRQGVIGRVYYSRGWYANTRESIGRGKHTSPPSWLNYELWQGPAPRLPFRDNLIHYNWHWFWHWGTGEAGNNGVHALDLCRWGLEVDYPTRVTSNGGRYHWQDDWETPDTQVITFNFQGGKSIAWEGLSCNGLGIEGSDFGVTFHGETGSIRITGKGYSIFDKSGKLVSEIRDESDFDSTGVHLENFLNSIRTGQALHSEILEGHKSTLLCHLGNMAQRTGHVLHCNPQNGHVLDDPEAAKLWGRAYEPGWEPAV